MCMYMCTCMLSLFSRVQLFVTPWTVARQTPLSMGFSQQEYWSGSHALLQGIFPTQGLNLHLLWVLHCRWNLYLLSHQGCVYIHTQVIVEVGHGGVDGISINIL